jgi:hypothetical protein
MKLSEVEKILEKFKRIRKRLEAKDGGGTSWSYAFENNEIHEYDITGVRPHEDIQDDIEDAFVWLWSLKDYVKKYSIKAGRNSQWVEDKVNLDTYLSVCADIANSLKHGGLDKHRRSMKDPRLGNVEYSIPQKAISAFTIYSSKVVTNVKNPTLVELKMDIVDKFENRIGDAFEYLDYAVKAWERIINEVDKNT